MTERRLTAKSKMSYSTYNVLRTMTDTADSFAPSLAAFEPTFGDVTDPIGQEYVSRADELNFYSLNQVKFQEVDNFWNDGAFGNVLPIMSSIGPEISARLGESPRQSFKFGFSRTVSGMARANRQDDLTMDTDYDDDSSTFSDLLASSMDDVAPMDDEDVSPIEVLSRDVSIASTTASEHSPSVPTRISLRRDVSSSSSSPASTEGRKLHLGEGGRAKLKSLISDAVKHNEELRERVAAITKVKLASIPQLLQMASICDLWPQVLLIAASNTRR